MLRAIFREYSAALTGLPAAVWWLSGVLLIHRAGTMVLPFLTLYITQDLWFSKTAAGWLLVAYGIGSTIGSLLGGRLSDRYGPRPVMLASLALSSVAFVTIVYVKTLVELGCALLVLGIVAESFRPANGVAIAGACARELHGRAFALQRLALNAGMTVGPLVGGFLAKLSYDLLFIANAVGCVAALSFFTFFVPPLKSGTGKSATGEGAPVATSPWRDGLFLLVLGGVFLSVFPFLQVFATAPVYYKEFYGFDERVLGAMFGVNTLVIVAIEMVLIHRVSHLSKLKVVAVGCLFFAVGTAMIPLSTGLLYATITVVVWTIGEILISPLAMAWIVERAPEGSTGRYLGLFATTFSIGHTVGPLAGLYLYEQVHPDAVWYTCATICLLIIPIFLYAAHRHSDAPSIPPNAA